MRWWCVCDRQEPSYGAHILLALNEQDAIRDACIRWYGDGGVEEFEGTLVAVLLPIDVTPEQLEQVVP